VESHFSASVYKFILGRELALEDLVHVDLVYYNSLAWFLENDIEAAELELVFVLEEEAMGQIVKVPLKEGGDTCAITNENKAEYVQLAAMHRLVGSVRPQLEALRAGFYEVMAPNVLEKFSEGELELLLHGMPVIDIEDWKKHCEYRAGFTDTHQVILWFWEIVDDWDQEMRARLLQFVTGTSKIPTGGFAGLYGANGPKRFQIIRVFDITRLPQANTCFNELLLPPYPTKELLADRLTQVYVYTCVHVCVRVYVRARENARGRAYFCASDDCACFVRVYVCVSACVYIDVYLYTYIHTYIYTSIHDIRVCTNTHTYKCGCICIYIHKHTYVRICIHTYIYIYIYIHVHVHICIFMFVHIHTHITYTPQCECMPPRECVLASIVF